MTQTVFTNSMVAHVWAQQNQPFGRSNNGQFYFEGPTLFSYGRHFVVGHIMSDGLTLLNADGYSITTSQHKSQARYAVRGRYIYMPGLTELVTGGVFRMSPATRRQALRQHIARHAERFGAPDAPSEAATWLGQLGKFDPAPILRRAAAKREKDKAEANARDRKHGEQDARTIADCSDKAFYEDMRATATHNLPGKIQRYVNAHRAASRRGWVRIKKTIWTRLGELRKYLDKREAAGRVTAHHYQRRQDIRQVRIYLERSDTAWDSTELRRFETAASRLVDVPRLGGSGEATGKFDSFVAGLRHLRELTKAQEERERFEREKAERDAWLAGEGHRSSRFSDERGGALLRAVRVERDDDGTITDGMLETSHGASVPLTHAVKAFRFIKYRRERAEGWQRNGQTVRVGHFQIDRIDPNGDFVAGCHRIHWPEVERIARALGVFDYKATDQLVERRGPALGHLPPFDEYNPGA